MDRSEFIELRQLMAKMGNLIDTNEQSSMEVQNQMKSELNTLRAELDEKIVMIKELNAEMNQKNELISVQEEIIAQNKLALKRKDEFIEIIQQALTAKDQIIVDQDNLLKHKDGIIIKREDLVGQKDAEVAHLKDNISDLNMEITKLNEIVSLQSDLLKDKAQIIEQLDVKIKQLEEINNQARKELNSNYRKRLPGEGNTLFDQLKISYYNSMSRCHLLEEHIQVLNQQIRRLGTDLVEYIINDACMAELQNGCDPEAHIYDNHKHLYPADIIEVGISSVSNDLIKMLDLDIKNAEAKIDTIVQVDKKSHKQTKQQSPSNKLPKINRKKFVKITSLAYF